MPNRLIRDEMLDSEAILSLPIEARWLYVTILLSADDLGVFEATSFKLARRADIRRESGDKLLQMLADADLIRLYEVSGKRFGFIPKFRQRIQIKRSKHPLPPEALMSDDEDAINKINELGAKTTVVQPLDADAQQRATAAQPSEAEAEAKDGDMARTASSPLSDCPHKDILALWAESLPTAIQPRDWTPSRAAALKARWREKSQRQNLDFWRRLFNFISKSDFLMGRVSSPDRRPFELSIDWLLKHDNFVKVIEGKYHSKEQV